MRHLALLTTALTVFVAAPAAADYFVWQDTKTGATLTYPDTWRMVNNQQPDDLVTVLGPSEADRPTCRLRARPDDRYTVYPVWYADAVQDDAYNEDFWDDYLGEFDNVQFHSYKDNAGLGKAFASAAIASYQLPGKDDKAYRSSQMWAGVYNDTAYILDCSSTNASFGAWQPDFLSIAKSVDLRKQIHELVTGDYPRNFIAQGHLTHPVMNEDDKMGQTFP